MNGNGNGNGNVIFYVSYGVLTEFLWMNVILARNSCVLLKRQRLNGTDTWKWKPGITV